MSKILGDKIKSVLGVFKGDLAILNKSRRVMFTNAEKELDKLIEKANRVDELEKEIKITNEVSDSNYNAFESAFKELQSVWDCFCWYYEKNISNINEIEDHALPMYKQYMKEGSNEK